MSPAIKTSHNSPAIRSGDEGEKLIIGNTNDISDLRVKVKKSAQLSLILYKIFFFFCFLFIFIQFVYFSPGAFLFISLSLPSILY